MASAGFAGLRGTGSWGTSERPTNFREMILWANPNGGAPLLALMAKMKKEATTDPQFTWWSEQLQNTRVAISFSTGYTTTATSFVLASGGLLLVAGDVLLAEATEQTTYTAANTELIMVTTVTSDTAIAVQRGVANSTPIALADTTKLTKIGNALQEGGLSPNISQRNPTKFTNYCQIFKTAVGITGTAKETKTRTGDGWLNDKKRKMFDHSTAIEWAMMYGLPYEDSSGAFPLRYTGGIRSFLTSNVTIFATTPTTTTFLNAVYQVFNYERGTDAGNERIVLAGNGALNALNQIAKADGSSRIIFNDSIEYYGMQLQKWILPQGTLYVKSHPLLNVHPKYTNSMFIIDPSGLVFRPLRDTRFQDEIQPPDADYRKGQWLTEAGLELQHEETMAYLGNFTYP